MIIDETKVGRYVFIFDINNAGPLNPCGITEPDDCFYEHVVHLDTWMIKPFEPMVAWVKDHTPACRFNVVDVIFAPETRRQCVRAIAVEIPVELAVLFRLFWY